ncbi:MAG: Eco57I restriction-modification methylase domain-containing protein [Geitlerinemataceae cyanobacterium]
MATCLTPRQVLSLAHRKLPIARARFETFGNGVRALVAGVSARPDESEEHYKGLLSTFLTETFYPASRAGDDLGEVWAINTSDRTDLAIERRVKNGKAAVGELNVLFELKKPDNAAEMPERDRLNSKAFQQLLYYFLQKRLTQRKTRIRSLIITNIYEWFVFDARAIETLFLGDRQLVRDFKDFEAGRLSYGKTDDFYKQAAAGAIARNEERLEFAYFDLRDAVAMLDSGKEADRNKLSALYKLFAPEHLAGLPFVNDSNTLDRGFYTELLHILGLTERKQGNTKTIQRQSKNKRDRGSLLENAMRQVERLGKLKCLSDPTQYGDTKSERLFNVALELAIVWINRILFLKLLEAQLLAYHGDDPRYRFLSLDKVTDYDEVSALFFHVLALRSEERDETVEKWAAVPYLNSSLFETTELELRTIAIGSLRDSLTMRVFDRTILRDPNDPRKKQTGAIATLEYLLRFLDAYDFSSAGDGEIRTESKTLISASVLGLVFEKINGYRDGAFFTPGYVTMYICRETLRQATVEKFNAAKGWTCRTLDDIYDKIEDKQEANAIFNGLKICDPSVGSGHFLVSALNEAIAIKSELKILLDADGKTLRDYRVRVENDELVVTDDDGSLFQYRPRGEESTRVQKALFEEKRRLIENCLFGVDINANSVSICRLRLWIELLKNAYYRDEALTQLETLPNIDINIKQGNSVISRYDIELDLEPLLQRTGYTIEQYRQAIASYYQENSRDEKDALRGFIAKLKQDLETEISAESDLVKQRAAKQKEYQDSRLEIIVKTGDEARDAKDREKRVKREDKLREAIAALTAKIEDFKSGAAYRQAMEWRFEFPEVLDLETGAFIGFDAIVGNPPYVRQEQIKTLKPQLAERFSTYAGKADLFVYFYDLGLSLLKPGGYLTYISSNKYFRAGYGKKLRALLAKETTIASLVDFGDYQVFEEATAYPSIIALRKTKPVDTSQTEINALVWDASRTQDVTQFPEVLASAGLAVRQSDLTPDGWRLESRAVLDLLAKLRQAGTPLGNFIEGQLYRGILTGLNDAFVIERETRDRLIAEDSRSAELLKPFLRGKDVKRWSVQFADQYLIEIKSSENADHPWSDKSSREAEKIFKQNYPAIWKFMNRYRERLIERYDKGRYFWELRSCKYWNDFLTGGVVYPDIAVSNSFAVTSESILDCTLFFIPTSSPMFVLGCLNSSVNNFFFPQVCPTIRGGFRRFKSIYVKQIPIPDPKKSPIHTEQIENLVAKILDRKQADPAADMSDLEGEIDRHLYQLYDLTADEIALVEAATN